MANPNSRSCWCGNADLVAFSPAYLRCPKCETLVVRDGPSNVQLQVNDDETDFYGKQYWLGHQKQDLGFADIEERARSDLAERNLHWLQRLLKYRLPGADLLELGCAHGSFLALAKEAGYRVTGVEMSPWVVGFGQSTFGVPIRPGPIESLDIAAGSLDVIALMDVLEHLPDPLQTMRRCLSLLRPDGILLVQTPRFKPELSYDALVASGDRFLEMLIPDEHIYLFSQESAINLFQRLGASHVRFEPALFPWYDMFFAVSRTQPATYPRERAETSLLATPGGRLVLALLDLRHRELVALQQLIHSEADRAARAGQIDTLQQWLKESETDRAARAAQITTLTTLLQASESDRSARVDQIDTLTSLVKHAKVLHVDMEARISSLMAQLHKSELDRAARLSQIEHFGRLLLESDADRAARLTQIEELSGKLQESERDRAARGEQIVILTALIRSNESKLQR